MKQHTAEEPPEAVSIAAKAPIKKTEYICSEIHG